VTLPLAFLIALSTIAQQLDKPDNFSLDILSQEEIATFLNSKTQKDTISSNSNEIEYFNIVKLNTAAIPFNNISVLYERMLMPKVSVGLGVGYKYAGPLPKVLEVKNSVFEVAMDKIKGFTLTPYGRYYLRTCNPTLLDGFYSCENSIYVELINDLFIIFQFSLSLLLIKLQEQKSIEYLLISKYLLLFSLHAKHSPRKFNQTLLQHWRGGRYV